MLFEFFIQSFTYHLQQYYINDGFSSKNDTKLIKTYPPNRLMLISWWVSSYFSSIMCTFLCNTFNIVSALLTVKSASHIIATSSSAHLCLYILLHIFILLANNLYNPPIHIAYSKNAASTYQTF